MSMYNDIVWGERENTEKCVTNSFTVADYARKILPGHWSFLGPGSEKKWYETYSDKWNGDGDNTAELMMLDLHSESGHPTFHATSALVRVELTSKGMGKKSFHNNGSEETIEFILRTFISVNQLSIYGAVADFPRNYPMIQRLQGNLQQMKIRNQWKSLLNFPLLTLPHTNAESQGNLLQDYEHKFEQLPEDQKLSKLCCDAGLKIVEEGQFFIALGRSIPGGRVDSRKHENRPGLGCESLVESLIRDRKVFLGSNCEWD